MFSNMGTFTMLVTTIPFVIVALFLLIMALRSMRRATASQSWVQTSGQIIASTLEARRSHSSSGGYSTAYYPVVTYQYVVNGQMYQGSRINFGSPIGSGFAGIAQRWLARFPAGATVPVYYNPNDPTQAVLERSAGGSSKILLGVAVFILVMLVATTAFMMVIFRSFNLL